VLPLRGAVVVVDVVGPGICGEPEQHVVHYGDLDDPVVVREVELAGARGNPSICSTKS